MEFEQESLTDWYIRKLSEIFYNAIMHARELEENHNEQSQNNTMQG